MLAPPKAPLPPAGEAKLSPSGAVVRESSTSTDPQQGLQWVRQSGIYGELEFWFNESLLMQGRGDGQGGELG